MTESLEDTIATALRRVLGRMPTPSEINLFAKALRAASVVPAEPATHDTLVAVMICRLCLSDWAGGECHTPGCAFWMNDAPSGRVLTALRAAVAAVDGEAPA